MSKIQYNRMKIMSLYKEPEQGWNKEWITGWMSNYEISDWMKDEKNENIHFFRFNQICDIDNIIICKNNHDPIAYYEIDRMEEEFNLYNGDPDFYFIESCYGLLEKIEDWKKNFKQDTVFMITDVRGHFVVCLKTFIKYDYNVKNSVIMFNSLWNNIFEFDEKGRNKYIKIMETLYDVFFE